MPSELHLSPDRLRRHAAAAAGLSEDLRLLAAGARADRWHDVARHAGSELDELSAALGTVAAATEAADDEVARSFGRLRGQR